MCDRQIGHCLMQFILISIPAHTLIMLLSDFFSLMLLWVATNINITALAHTPLNYIWPELSVRGFGRLPTPCWYVKTPFMGDWEFRIS